MIKKLVLTLAAACSCAMAADDWVEIATGGGRAFSVKASTVRLGNNDSGVPVVLATGRITYADSGKIEANMWYVPLSHCKAKQGNMGITDVNGNFQTSIDFVFGLGSVGSQIAETLCSVADGLNKTGKSKPNSNT